ncbi:hypothetical protein DFS33DRAFT_1369159 [Desarmillaria ectypa]|nr:hypothetical protein DFS33DRAFT_1369159 [Desarmillaria ectypa]
MLPNSVLGLLRLVLTREIRQIVRVGKLSKKIAQEIMASHNEVTFVISGPETSSTSLSWLLYKLALHPEHQSVIHAELKQSNGYDSMPFLNTAIKESLRLPKCTFLDTYRPSR